MVIMAVLVIYPLIFVIMTSLKTNEDVILNPFAMNTFCPSNYVNAWIEGHVGTYLGNSVIVTFSAVAVQTVLIILASYAFGKLCPPGNKILFFLVLSGLFVTAEMTVVVVFSMLKSAGLVDTRLGVILPYIAMGLPMGIFILTNSVKGLPKELDEAAIIDGAGTMKIMTKIDVPLLLPAIATVVVLNFQGVWSDFYYALIFIRSDAIKTLPLGLINFQSEYSSNYGVLSAGLVLLTLPILILYLAASKTFMQGMTAGAVKG